MKDDSTTIKRTRVALHNSELNIQTIAQEFCLEYTYCPELTTPQKHVFTIKGLKNDKQAFIQAIKTRVEKNSY